MLLDTPARRESLNNANVSFIIETIWIRVETLLSAEAFKTLVDSVYSKYGKSKELV